MKKLLTLSVLCLSALSLYGEMLFHFDFSKANGKKEISDRTGKFRCISEGYDFYIQNSALRIAPDAKITVPMKKKSDGKTMSFCSWVLTGGKGNNVIFFKGLHPFAVEYALMLNGAVPEFCYKNLPGQNFWKGVHCIFRTQTLVNKKWIVPGADYKVSPGKWTHLAYTFDNGSIAIYINGKKVLNAPADKPEKLRANTLPGRIGSDKSFNTKDNFSTAELLVNDIKVFSNVLKDGEIAAIYAAEKTKYPAGKIKLKECYAYLDKSIQAFDPDFKNRLPITKAYLAKLKKTPPAAPAMEKVTQKFERGKVRFYFDNKEMYPFAALPGIPNYATTHQISRSIEDFAAGGVKLMSHGYWSMNVANFWKGEGKYNWAHIDSRLKTVAESAPESYIFIDLFVVPPEWYFDRYPEEREMYYPYNGGGLKRQRFRAPLCTDRWIRTACRMLKDLTEHIENGPYGKRVYTYLVGGGASAEWYWPATWKGVTGYSEGTQKSFRRWIRNKYKNDVKALRKAWNNKTVTFETVAVPSPAERRKADFLFFKDPAKNRPAMDLNDFMNDRTEKNIIEMCKAVKEATNFKKTVITYNGYCLLYHGQFNMHNNGLRTVGTLLDSPYVDGIATPVDYNKRRGGEPGLNINPFYAGAKLRNKIIWQEHDLRTHLCKEGLGRTANLQETNEVIKRALGSSLTTGGGFWFYSIMHPAHFHEEGMIQTIAQMSKIAEKTFQYDASSKAQVALIVDEHTSRFLNQTSSPYLKAHAWGAYLAASRMGAPFDTWLMTDLDNPQMPDYKLYIFLNNYNGDSRQIEMIKRKIRKNNAVSVWCYAPAFITDKGFTPDAMKDLTGMKFDVEKKTKQLYFDVADPKHIITRKYVAIDPCQAGPVFTPSAPGMKTLMTADGKAALTVLEQKNWRSVYTAIPLTKELLMGLCDYAGVHVYSRSFDVFDRNQSFMMLHSTTAGKKTIKLDGRYTVKELYTNKTLGKNVSVFTDTVPEKTTRLYLLTQ